jgi:hypothetical protein
MPCNGSSLRRALSCVLSVALLATALVLVAAEPAPAAGPTYVSGTISSSTTWTAANSPYVLTGTVTVNSSATLTIEPGVVVRFQKPVSGQPYRLVMQGTLVAVGSPSQHITFTSDLDPAAGGSGTPARGAWRSINFLTPSGVAPSTASILRYVDARYGGYGTSCASFGEVELQDGRPLVIENSTFAESQNAGVVASGSSTDQTRVSVTLSTFESSCDGLSAVQREFTARHNYFASTVTRYQLSVNSTDNSVVEMNHFSGKVSIDETSTGLNTIRYNDFLSRVLWAGSSTKPKDLRWNWWGHVVDTPPFCVSTGLSTDPEYITQWVYPNCAPAYTRVTDYKTLVLPALPGSAFLPGTPSGGSFTGGNWRGGSNAASGAQPCGSNEGEPVECSSGNFWHTFAGLSIPGRGKALDFTFTYNADAAGEDGPLGFGWTHSYNLRVTTSGSTATVHQENGAQVPFTQSGSTWTAPSRFDATLTSTGSSCTGSARPSRCRRS